MHAAYGEEVHFELPAVSSYRWLCAGTCSIGTVSVLQEAVGVSRHQLIGSPPAPSLVSRVYTHVYYTGCEARSQCNAY